MHPTDLLPDYLLGELEPQELGQLEAHLQTCESCKAELRQMNQTLVEMTESLPATDVPLTAWKGIQDKLAPKVVTLPPRLRRIRWEAFAVAASLLLALGSSWWGFNQYQAKQSLTNETALITRWLARADARVVALPQVNEYPFGSVIILPDNRALFVLRQKPEAGSSYQAWGYINDKETSLAVTDSQILEVDYTGYDAIGLSIEPTGGSDWSTQDVVPIPVVEEHTY